MFASMICENYHLMSETEKQRYDSQGNLLFLSEIQTGGNGSQSTSAEGGEGAIALEQSSLNPDGDQQSFINLDKGVHLDKESLILMTKIMQKHLSKFETGLEARFKKNFEERFLKNQNSLVFGGISGI